MTTYDRHLALARTALRRDRLLASVWVLAARRRRLRLGGRHRVAVPDDADRVEAAEAINASPAIVALYGPILDVRSVGELAMTKLTVLYAVFAALLFLVLVRRHTRTEEESGRAELLGGTAVGRDAQLAAAVLESVAGRARARRALRRWPAWAAGCRSRGRSRSRPPGSGIGLGRHRPDRRRLPGLRQRPHLRGAGRRRHRPALRPPRHRRHRAGLAVVALAVRLVDAAAGLVGPAVVGAPPRPGPRRRPARDRASACRRRRDLGAGLVAPRPGPAHGSPRLADALVAHLAGAPHHARGLDRRRRRRSAW